MGRGATPASTLGFGPRAAAAVKIMTMATGKRQKSELGVMVAALFVIAAPAFAQPAAQPQNVEVDPVQCWWRTSVTSVRVGEPFSIVLTCSALETEAANAVIDRSRLGSAAV